VVVVVVLEVLLVLVDVVVGIGSNIISIYVVHVPVDNTLIVVVKSGTSEDAYPASKSTLGTAVSNAVVNPSRFEYKLKGPESVPAVVNVINAVIWFYFIF
jgi:hypothetical protein